MTDLQLLAMRLYDAREDEQRRLVSLAGADNALAELNRHLRTSLGLPADASDAELDAALAAEVERLLGPQSERG